MARTDRLDGCFLRLALLTPTRSWAANPTRDQAPPIAGQVFDPPPDHEIDESGEGFPGCRTGNEDDWLPVDEFTGPGPAHLFCSAFVGFWLPASEEVPRRH